MDMEYGLISYELEITKRKILGMKNSNVIDNFGNRKKNII